MKRALITGILGQDGTYLAEHLLSMGYKVFGLTRRNPETSPVARDWMRGDGAKVEYIYGDMKDALSLRAAIKKSWPDEIYNLAGQVFVPVSWEDPIGTMNVNTAGLLRLMKCVLDSKPDARIYQASSSEMFGNHEGMCDDKSEFNPTSPYGFSKLMAHRLAKLYRERGVWVACGILFNHESPRRGHEMVTRKIAAQVAAWAGGDEGMMGLGNMDSRRDWGYAGEYVKAMHLMLQEKDPDDYVVGTGESHSVEEFLYAAAEAAGLNRDWVSRHVSVGEKNLTRTQEIYSMRANNEKIQKVLGWSPMIKFEQLVKIMVSSELAAKGLLKAAVTT